MKLFVLLAALFTIAASADECGTKKKASQTYKGRLEVKGICMNYTISVLEGDADTSLVASSWTDETTGKSYKNAFALGSRCTFPSTIEQGDEFYFVIDTLQDQQCAVCMAFYPTPPKKLSIKVVEK